MPISPNRFLSLRTQWAISQDKMGLILGVTGKYVGMLERGEKKVDDDSSLGLLFRILEPMDKPPAEYLAVSDGEPEKAAPRLVGDETPYHTASTKPGCRMVPVIGMAHAGERMNYDEVPCDADDYIATTSTDLKAFGVIVAGDSMWPDIRDRDIVTVEPSRTLYSNDMAILRLADDGVLARRVEIRGDHLRLIPSNDRYEVEMIPRADIKWAYPILDAQRRFTR